MVLGRERLVGELQIASSANAVFLFGQVNSSVECSAEECRCASTQFGGETIAVPNVAAGGSDAHGFKALAAAFNDHTQTIFTGLPIGFAVGFHSSYH